MNTVTNKEKVLVELQAREIQLIEFTVKPAEADFANIYQCKIAKGPSFKYVTQIAETEEDFFGGFLENIPSIFRSG